MRRRACCRRCYFSFYNSRTPRYQIPMFHGILAKLEPASVIEFLMHLYAESGIRIETISPYAYQEHPTEKIKIIPNLEAAEVIRHMP